MHGTCLYVGKRWFHILTNNFISSESSKKISVTGMRMCTLCLLRLGCSLKLVTTFKLPLLDDWRLAIHRDTVVGPGLDSTCHLYQVCQQTGHRHRTSNVEQTLCVYYIRCDWFDFVGVHQRPNILQQIGHFVPCTCGLTHQDDGGSPPQWPSALMLFWLSMKYIVHELPV